MTIWKTTKGQTIYEILHRKLQIEQLELAKNGGELRKGGQLLFHMWLSSS